jgi:hypothetical protein
MSFSENEIIEQLALTRGASTSLALATSEKKNEILFSLAQLLLENSAAIIAENEKDLASIAADDPMRDRLLLNSDRISHLSKSVLEIAKLTDPTGQILTDKILSNGLKFRAELTRGTASLHDKGARREGIRMKLEAKPWVGEQEADTRRTQKQLQGHLQLSASRSFVVFSRAIPRSSRSAPVNRAVAGLNLCRLQTHWGHASRSRGSKRIPVDSGDGDGFGCFCPGGRPDLQSGHSPHPV